MDIVVGYDIQKNSTRRSVLKILREWRLDGQKSVHECRMNKGKAEELFIQLGTVIDPENDSLILARVSSRRKILARGVGRHNAFSTNLRMVR